jgi:mannose-1-phosphate guanylyltransferase
MILCAGLGTRLHPLTEHWPKAAIPVLGTPLFRFNLALLKAIEVEAVAINTHHLAEEMEAVASAEAGRFALPLTVSREPKIQGTAGGIRGCHQSLRDGDFVVINGDVLFPLALARVVKAHRRSGAAATLVVMPMPVEESYRAVEADASGRVRLIAGVGPGGSDLRAWHFTGVHVMSPEVFDFIDPRGPQDINRDVYPRMLERGLSIQIELASEYWSDLGTPRRYLRVVTDMLSQKVPVLAGASPFASAHRKGDLWFEEGATVREPGIRGPCFFDRGCVVEQGVILGPPVYVGPGALIASGARLTRSAVLGDTRIAAGEDLIDTVAYHQHRVRAAPS